MKKVIFVLMLLCVVTGVRAVEFREVDIDDYRIVYQGNELVIDKMLFDGSKPVFSLNFYGNEVNLTEQKKEEINLIIYYHYGKSPTTQRYVETQVLIFMYLSNLKSYNVYDKNNNSISVHYTTYNSIIENHMKLPSFNGMSYVVGLNEVIEIPDYNYVVLNYATEEVDGLVIAKYYTKLEVVAKKFGSYTINFVKEASDLGEVKVYDNKYIGLGGFARQEASVNIVVPAIEVEFVLEHEDTDAVYNIYDGDGNLLEQVSLKNGLKYQVKDKDKIIIEEVSHNEIYEDNPNIYEFDTKDNKKITVNYKAEFKKYALEINSCLFSEIQDKCLKRVSRDGIIYDNGGNEVMKIKTNDEGVFETDLQIGSYRVVIDDEEYLVDLTSDQVIWHDILVLEKIVYDKVIDEIYDVEGNKIEFEMVDGEYLFKPYLEEGSYYLINELGERINFEVEYGVSGLVIDDSYEVIKPEVEELPNDEESQGEILIDVPNTNSGGMVIYVDNKKRYISFGSGFMFVVCA